MVKGFKIFLTLLVYYHIFGCGSSIKESKVESPDMLATTQCIAVLPLENRTTKGMAGYNIAEIIASELISSRAFGVMEPVEALRTMQGFKIKVPDRYDPGKAVEIGRAFGVDGVVVGILKEYSFKGPFGELNEGNPSVSFELRMINTKNGAVVWTSTINKTGSEVTDVSRDYLLNFARSTVKEAIEPILDYTGPRNIAMPCWNPKAPVVATKPAGVETPASVPPPPSPAMPVAPSVTTPPAEKAKPPAKPGTATTPPPVKVGPARIELVNASGNTKVVDNVGMTLLMNNHDLRKMSDQKTQANSTVIYYRPGFEAEAGKIMVEIKKGKTQVKPDLPGDIDIQIILGKDLL